MAKLTETVYERPAQAEKPNPFIDAVKQYTDKGIDTAFAVTFNNGAEYKAEKLQIQRAVNVHGFTAREVETDFDAETPEAEVVSTFVIRPARKRKADDTE